MTSPLLFTVNAKLAFASFGLLTSFSIADTSMFLKEPIVNCYTESWIWECYQSKDKGNFLKHI